MIFLDRCTTKANKRSDLFALCKAAPESSAKPLDTRQLARHVITAEGWETDDRRVALAMLTILIARLPDRSLQRTIE